MNKYFLYLISIFIIIIILYGCESPNNEGEIEFSHSALFNLIVNSDSQEIYIYKSMPIKDSLNSYNLSKYFEHNAIISIENDNFFSDDFTVKIASIIQDLAKVYHYGNNSRLNLYPNNEYILKIKINDKMIVGRTHTPSNFEILEPNDSSKIYIRNKVNNLNIEIRWRRSHGAKGYIGEIIRLNLISLPDTSFIQKSKSTFITQDTSFIFTDIGGKGEYEIKILAYDENFHNHFFENIQSAGIIGAYGYFGSSVQKTRKIMIVSE